MKRFCLATLVLVLAFGSMALASDEAQFPITLSIDPYMAVYNVTNDPAMEHIKGLFGGGESLSGEPGIYISDGGATGNYANSLVSTGVWDGTWDLWYTESTLRRDSEYVAHVEKFAIQANTDVEVTFESNFVGWPNIPTFFRISSSSVIGEEGDHAEGFGRGRGAWGTDVAVIGNDLNDGGIYASLYAAHNDHFDQEDRFDVDFIQCTGPVLYHINGGLLIPKADAVEARDDYQTILVVTVAARTND